MEFRPIDYYRHACIWGEALELEQELDFFFPPLIKPGKFWMKTFSKAVCKTAKCENDYKWQLIWKSTNQKGFPVSELRCTITWLHPNQVEFQTKGWWLLQYLFLNDKKIFKKNIPDTNSCFQEFIEKYYFNINCIYGIWQATIRWQIAIWGIIIFR